MQNQNIKLILTNRYSLSISQGIATSHVTDYVEVALYDYKRKSLVSPVEWCMPYYSGENGDDVICGCDAHELLDLLQQAKEWVMLKGDEYV